MLKNVNFLSKLKRVIAIVVCIFWCIIIYFTLGGLIIKKTYPLRYKEQVVMCANQTNLNPYLIFSVIKVESGFNKNAVSKKGAIGLMQLLPTTASWVAKSNGILEYDLQNALDNIMLGSFYLKYLVNKFKQEKTAIVAYNAGEGRVKEWLSLPSCSKDGKTLAVIPYKESEQYLAKIQKTFAKYKKRYGNFLDNN